MALEDGFLKQLHKCSEGIQRDALRLKNWTLYQEMVDLLFAQKLTDSDVEGD